MYHCQHKLLINFGYFLSPYFILSNISLTHLTPLAFPLCSFAFFPFPRASAVRFAHLLFVFIYSPAHSRRFLSLLPTIRPIFNSLRRRCSLCPSMIAKRRPSEIFFLSSFLWLLRSCEPPFYPRLKAHGIIRSRLLNLRRERDPSGSVRAKH